MSNWILALRSTLAKKVTLLWALILASNIVLFFSFAHVMSRFEESLRQEYEARQVSVCLSQFASAIQFATFALVDRSRTESNTDDLYSSVFGNLPRIFAELKHSLRNHPEENARLRELSLALDEAIGLVRRVEVSYWKQRSPNRKLAHLQYCSELITTTNTISNLLTALDEKYRGLETAEDLGANLRTIGSVYETLLLALLFNTVVTCAAFLLVVEALLKRIKVISQNTINTGLGKPLTLSVDEEVKDDELGTLEQEFRDLALHLSSAKSREALVLEHAADFICLLDQKAIILRVSEPSSKLLGYPAGDLIGRRLNSIVEAGNAEALVLAIKSLTQANSATTFECRMKLGSGEKRDFSFRANLSSDNTIVCVGHDVTVKNQLSAKIRESEERFRTILNSLPLMVIGLSQAGQIISVNDFGVSLSQYPEDELLGQSLESLFSTQKLLRKDGSYLAVELVLSNYAEEGQSDKKSLAFVRDISVREQIESAKRDFVNMIGHDLRSPLMSLSATLSYISKATSLPQVVEAERTFRDLIALTTDFLYLGRLEAGEEELAIVPVPFSNALTGLVESITLCEQTSALALSSDSKALTIAEPPQDFLVSVDNECFSLALTHLLRILCSVGSAQSRYVIDFRYQPYQLEILIAGSNLSLAPSTLASLSQGYVSFSQASGDLRSGLSLGLAIAILNKHGFNLKQYQSSKQQGFHIVLPLLS
ncbi:MAG: PAS domain S-box protein [Candidatus Obscuribacterales bacterium]